MGTEPAGPAALRVERASVVVVGAGVAGLSVALEVGGRLGEGDAVVLTDAELAGGGSTPWAQGGLAAALGDDDSTGLHALDTQGAGAGLVDELVARLVTDGAPEAIAWLAGQGARFDRDPGGRLVLGREAAHSRQRIVHSKDATGSELARALTAAALASPGTRLVEGTVAIDLLRRDGAVVGVLARRRADRELVAYLAPAVVLASGGYAHLWAATTTPPEAMGDGVAMAARAGAELADLEFVQFHPTALASGADPRPLLTEALRGEGATLVDETGDRFTLATDPAGELAPRDVVARATYRHLAGGHAAYLDARQAVGERFPERFPTVFAHAQRAGLDPRRDLLPVSPAAHYCMGGVATDDRGRTTVRGLWAAGEVASTGLHGANRLASNSLVEGVVMGRRVAADILAAGGGARGAEAGEWAAAVAGPVEVPMGAVASDEADVEGVVEGVREVLWDRVGLERDGAGLLAARDELASLGARVGASRPARNAVLVAELVVEAAAARTESRGAHFRRDHPTTDPTAAWRRATRRAPVATEAWATGLDGGALVPAAVATLAVAR